MAIRKSKIAKKLKAPKTSIKDITRPIPKKRGKSRIKKVTKKIPHRSSLKTIKKPYNKVRNITKKLNKRPDKKIIEKKAKKFFRKALKKSTKLTKSKVKATFKKLEKVDPGIATKAELKQYIKDATKLLNEAYPTMSKASKQAMKEAQKIIGKGEEGFLSSITSGDRKDLLVEKTRMLEAIINGDGVSEISLIKHNMKLIKQYNSFKRGPFGRDLEGLTFEEYNNLVNVAGKIERILGDYYNRYMFQQLHQYKDTLGMETVGDIMIKTYKNARTPGMTTKDMDLAIIKALKEELAH